MSTVPIFAPDAQPGDQPKAVPYAQMHDAVVSGGKPAVLFEAPDGKQHYVPADQTQDAVRNGGKLIHIDDQPAKSFWSDAGSALWSDLKGMVTSGAQMAPHILEAGGGTFGDLTDDVTKQASAIAENWRERSAKGEGLPYKVGAAANEALGVNVKGEEESAAAGEPGGVLGHAAAVPVATAASAGLAKGTEVAAPKIVSAAGTVGDVLANATPKQVGQVVGGVSGGVVGAHGTPALSPVGAFYGAKGGGRVVEAVLGKERASQPLIARKAPFNAGAALPEVPEPALVQGNALAEGGKPVSSPSDALGQIPVEQQIPGVNVRPNIERVLEQLPRRVVYQAEQQLGPKATKAEITALSNKLFEQLNAGTGGKALEPNTPLKNQGGIVTPKPAEVQTLPEGHTPVDSSAVSSFKYDPKAKELDIATPNGGRYVYGDVSPEQAKAFGSGEYSGQKKGTPPSVGKAWNDVRNNSVLVKKLINGKLQPIRPVSNPEDAISPEEWEAGQQIETQVEGTPRR